MQNLPLDFAMLKDEAGRDSNMETDQRVKRGERTKWLALGDRESGLLGIGRYVFQFSAVAKITAVTVILQNNRSNLKLTDLYQSGEVAHDWHKVEFDG